MDGRETPASDDVAPLFWLPKRLGSAWQGHVPFAHWLVHVARPRTLVELGTHTGVSYSAFCEAVARSQTGTRCFAVDSWKGDRHAGFYGDEIFTEFKRFHDANYAAFSTLLRMEFDEAAGRFADGEIDILHIDGLHTYEAVRHDFETWLPKLSASAVVLLHDTNERQGDFGVWRFWAEVKHDYPAFEFLHSHGLGVLCVGGVAPERVRALCAIGAQDGIDAVRGRFEAASRMVGDEMRRRSDLERELGTARRQIAERDGRIGKQQDQIAAQARQADEQTKRVAALSRDVERLRRANDELRSSTSWRITGPLRSLSTAARELLGHAGAGRRQR